MGTFIPVTPTEAIGKNEMLPFTVDGVDIVVVNLNGNFYALKDTCPHAGAPISNGYIRGESLMCAYHGAKFRIQDGAVLTPPAMCAIPSYSVRIENGMIEVEIEA
ncbi:MAG: Rieske 2Fe-2S domain-containing protein [Acidobacteria bacterium]|nr:Rieske 2Fe-2S domain-containing protein [Acidobacteriota bacterium]